MVVVYAEKPDMAEKIASALGGSSFKKSDKKQGFYKIRFQGKEFAVTWGYGHLCTLAEAQEYNEEYKNWRNIPLPFIPNDFKIVLNLKSRNPVSQTYKIVKKLFNEAEWIINATDFDREGELIFWYLYSYMRCNKPIMRAKLASTTVDGIMEAFTNLMQTSSFAGLLESARCRSIADWVVGINLTVAMTLTAGGGNICSIGRVQTPTLAMVVDRDREIAEFKPEDYFTVEAVFTADKGETYKATHETKKFPNRDDAQQVLNKCLGHEGTVISLEKEEKRKKVPYLYNLDTLQMDANTKYGLSLKTTLDVTQKLYEKGLVTYPRTDCQFLPEDMEGQIINIQDMLKNNGYGQLFNNDAQLSNMQNNRKTFFDDKKLGSHYAIIPTMTIPAGLDDLESKVYGLVAGSVIRMLYPAAVFESTKVITQVNGENFLTTGSRLAEPGWMFVSGREEDKDEFLPDLHEGESVDGKYELLAKKTTPPKHYTDKTLLGAMISAGKNLEDDDLKAFMAKQKNSGIGTVATRAGIIETLLARGYIVREKGKLLATTVGTSLINSIPVAEVKSAAMTAEYEKRLNEIVEGRENSSMFLRDVYNDVGKWCKQIDSLPHTEVKRMANTSLMCPVCGAPLNKMKWGYGCSEYKNGCKFTLGAICGKILTENQAEQFLSKEKLGPLKFTKKDGTKFEATICLVPVEEDGKIVNYKAEFEKRKSLKDNKPDLYSTCPNCHARIIRGNYGWDCEKGCGIHLPYELCSRQFTQEEAEALFSQKTLPTMDGFISKKNKPFSAGLMVNGNKIEFYFPKR